MKQIRKRLTYANVMSSTALFLVLDAGTAYAASQLAKNSVGTAQLRDNSVTASKLDAQSVGNEALTNPIRAKLNQAGPEGPPGPVGAAGPTGPPGANGAAGLGAVRLHLSEDGTEGASAQPIGTVGGLTLKAACDTTAGQTSLVFSVNAQEAGVIQENFQNDTGSDPHVPGEPQAGNLQIDLPAGESTLGGPPGVPSGTYFRTIASLIFTTQTQTTSLEFASLTDGSTAHCSADGVGVPASG